MARSQVGHGLLAALVAASWTTAQVPERTFFKPVDVRVVSVEVVALDERGFSVRGLTADDFELFEDGSRVEISHFFAAPGVSLGELGASSFDEPWADQGLILVVLVDEANISPGNGKRALRRLREFFAGELPPRLRVILASYDGSLRVRQPLTENMSLVANAIEEVQLQAGNLATERDSLLREMQAHAAAGKPTDVTATVGRDRSLRHVGFGQEGQIDAIGSMSMTDLRQIHDHARWAGEHNRIKMDAVQRFIRSLSGVAGRKALLFVGDGIDGKPGASLYQAWEQIYAQVARGASVSAAFEARENDSSTEALALLEFANSQRLSVYALNTRGERVFEGVQADANGFGSASGFASQSRLGNSEVLAILAEATGGRNLANNRRLGEQLEAVARDLGGYYSLGYQPHHYRDGRYHNIKVRAKHGDYRLLHREGFRDRSGTEVLTDRTLAAAVLGETHNPLGISAEVRDQSSREDGRFLVPIRIRVPLRRMALVPAGGEHAGKVAIVLAVQNQRGGLSPIHHREMPVQIANRQLVAAMDQDAEFIMGLVMDAGQQRVAVGVRDEYGRADSTVVIDVEVGTGDG